MKVRERTYLEIKERSPIDDSIMSDWYTIRRDGVYFIGYDGDLTNEPKALEAFNTKIAELRKRYKTREYKLVKIREIRIEEELQT